MRRDIDRHPERIKGILLDDGVRKTFLDGVSRQESRAVKAFVDTNSGNAAMVCLGCYKFYPL